jgi:hypothetical protein
VAVAAAYLAEGQQLNFAIPVAEATRLLERAGAPVALATMFGIREGHRRIQSATAPLPGWTLLGHREAVADATGRLVTVTKFARELLAGVYVLRTDYPTDQVSADGRSWRTSYLTAHVNCHDQTMHLVRFDYHSAGGERVSTIDGRNTPMTLNVIARLSAENDFFQLYRYACF